MKIEPDAAGMSEGRLERITEHFARSYVDPGKIAGCQITVVRGGHVAYHRSLGLMDRERGIPMADDTIFRIYSMTKPIASVALMQLYERGMFQLLDPVHRYIPEWRTQQVGEVKADGSITLVKPERPMNMRDVLMHTTGLPGGLFADNPIDAAFDEARAALGGEQTLESVTALLAEHPLKFHPGTHWNYGLSTDIVGRLVEILSGLRLDEYLRRGALRAARHGRHRVLRPRGVAAPPGRLLPVPPGQHPALDGGPVRQRVPAPPFLPLRRGRSGLDHPRLRRLLPDAGQRRTARRAPGPRTQDPGAHDRQPLPGGATLQDMAVGGFGEAGFEGVGFGLGFAVGLGPAATAMAGSGGEFYWGGAASTAFWVDPVEDLFAVFMTQLFPSVAYPFRAQLRALVYQAIDD